MKLCLNKLSGQCLIFPQLGPHCNLSLWCICAVYGALTIGDECVNTNMPFNYYRVIYFTKVSIIPKKRRAKHQNTIFETNLDKSERIFNE